MPIAIKNSIIDISSEETTKELAKELSNYLKGGEIIFLYGEMGVGKTTFVKYLINQFQIKKNLQTTEVTSPTFNLLNEYEIDDFRIKHYDLFRLKDKSELKNLDLFENDKSTITFIEWPQLINKEKLNKTINLIFNYENELNNRSVKIDGLDWSLNMKLSKDFKEIKGDASIRKFYRNTKKNSIIVFANIEKIKNLLIYDSINKILIKNNIIAPKLLSQNYRNNYIEIQDLGNKTIFQTFTKNKKNHYLILKKVINVLNKIQKIKDKKIKNFKNKLHKIKNYNNKVLFDETKLFNDWYVPKKLNKKKIHLFKYKFNKEIKLLLSKLNFKNDTFVHRDFHVSNLIINSKNQIGLIDNQDALIGNRAYDLASLIDDVRYKTSDSLKDKTYSYYLKTNKKINKKKFKNDFDILSVLRNLKIIGIFTRLAARDKKKKYLKLIPYAWKMIDSRMSKNKDLYNLKLLLASSFPKFITKLDEN